MRKATYDVGERDVEVDGAGVVSVGGVAMRADGKGSWRHHPHARERLVVHYVPVAFVAAFIASAVVDLVVADGALCARFVVDRGRRA